MIKQRKHITKSFERFASIKNTKFNIKSDKDTKNTYDEKPSLDYLYSRLNDTKISSNYIKDFYEFISSEEYDTETIEYDICNITYGNIVTLRKEITDFIQSLNGMTLSLHIL